MDEVWSERNTTPAKIEAALRQIVTEHHHSDHPFVPARVLNVVVVVDGAFRGEIENRFERVGRYHPSRLVLCAVEPGRDTIDAWAGVGTDDAHPVPGHIAVARERVEIEIGPRHLSKLDTIVDPLLVTDLATMVWAPHGHADAVDALRRLAQIVLVDTQDEPDVARSLARVEDLSEHAYVVDLAWLRSTPWRERVAAAFDPPHLRSALGGVSAVTVRHREDSLAAAMLFCGWLSSRLGWKPGPLSRSDQAMTGHARARRQEVKIRLEPTHQDAPGLAGRDDRDRLRRGGLARPRARRPEGRAPRARRLRAELDRARRLARRGRDPRARASARRCCATRPTGRRWAAPGNSRDEARGARRPGRGGRGAARRRGRARAATWC